MTLDVVVVGSGPGGAVTARECARAGLRVLVLEEGARADATLEPWSQEQLRSDYRGGGLTAAVGRPSIAYAEGRCLGGGSEVNSGLYHRLPEDVRRAWAAQGVEGLEEADLRPHQERVEHDLAVAARPDDVPEHPGSAVLRRGAERLGWPGREVPRWVSYVPGSGRPERRSMSATYLADAVAAGAEVRTGARVRRVLLEDGRARGVVVGSELVAARHVVVAGGSVQTPALLQRSGVRRHVGGGLAVHPTVKAVATFPAPVSDPADLPSYQVKAGVRTTLGGSASRPALLTLSGLAPDAGAWERRGVFYAAVLPDGRGRVRAVPGFADPVVTYALRRTDWDLLRAGWARLAHLLIAAGAEEVAPDAQGLPAVHGVDEVGPVADALGPGTANLMTVHLCGSVAMGREASAPLDSHGVVKGVTGLRVNDSSVFPGPVGVNPQGTVMALAHRNVARFLQEVS